MDLQPLLQKYFKGECTEAEQALVERYLAGEATPELDALLMQTWREAETDPKIKQLPRTQPVHWYRIAAAVTLLIVGAAGAWMLGAKRNSHKALASLAWDTLSNKGGELQRYHLPDGSVVWLNAYSHVVYNEDYNTHNRELWLEGEGYFEAAPGADHPFQVHTGNITTMALGTTFNISTANHADGSIEVSLLTGRVAVSTTDAAHQFRKELLPGQRLLFSPAGSATVATFHEPEVMDWKQGKIVFDKVNMNDAFARLQQRYGCRIILEDSLLAHKKISGTFSASQPLEQVIATLRYVHDFTYTQVSANTYLIHKH